MIELTGVLQSAVEEHCMEPIRVVNPRTREEYVLVRAEVYEKLKSCVAEENLSENALPENDAEANVKEELKRLTPSNAILLALAERCRPPSEWLNEEEENPFESFEE